ncbi:Planctomycete cytochrome C [Polystyrenella longa]|uniref:Planctomycete cytochrome C n=1 Tax=Polystyrenella longa TaxID=2528007 RepID=A0A518CKX7_9PLAN|nr:PSD1 and planctomycete cytochrome C domain-containing protein [Polystyrenella longa]QDU79881.1 Planctomycete cytochrome C [Polystyrenella longa]
MRTTFLLISLVGLLLVSARLPLRAGEPVEYNRDIRPILSDNCFQCHGPDENAREANLRLDLRDSALVPLSDYAAIVPGDAEHSGMMLRVRETDPSLRMPPAETKKQLTKREIELLQEWINQGAEYQQHWAFLPVEDVEPPRVETENRNHPIDRFIAKKLEAKGLTPSPTADPETIIRRLYLDLVGLLPEPSRVDAFVMAYEQNRKAATNQLVDELLASKHYGERWGRHWLDQARYADSHGYTVDSPRIMWPYRDWVIQALNEDMPFDQFTIEQLAGDLLPEPTKAQLVATGFHRNTLINQEGGTDDEQFRNEEVVDRVNTTGAVWLGLTVGCAQCHTHKFDPISHQEYFELFAFFNHTVDVNNTGPTVEVCEGELLLEDVDPELWESLQAAERKLAELTRTKSSRQTAWEKSLSDYKADSTRAVWQLAEATRYQSTTPDQLTSLEDGSLLAKPGAPREVYTLEFNPPMQPVTAVRLRVLTHESLPQQGPGLASNGNFVLTEVEILQSGEPVEIARVQADHAQPDFPAAHTVDGDSKTGWAINIGAGSAPGATMNAPHETHFILKKPLLPANGPVTVVLRHELNNEYNIGRFAIDFSETTPAPISESVVRQIAMLAVEKRTDAQKKQLAAAFSQQDFEQNATEKEVRNLKKKLGLGKPVKAMVMREIERPRETYIHERGDFLRKDKKTGLLNPNTPEIFPPLVRATENSQETETEKRASRLDLARWLVDEENPLTARVTVNRVWMRYFGQGLVKTENDFGTQGAYPTHPELLDWLARSFMESGWSMKQLHKRIVTSETYLQSSHHREELTKVDPLNLLLGRQNRLRLDAEILRDVSLTASGLLDETIGGPSVYPPQPEGVYAFTQTKKAWEVDTDGARYRRGMYTFFYRSAPYPFLTTFNTPEMQSVCTSRTRSNTPLQSLTMANDATIFEMAQGLAARLLTDIEGTSSSTNRERVRHLYRVCFAREPFDKELNRVIAFKEKQEELFRLDAEAAEVVINTHLTVLASPETAAAWTAVARAIMNTDEFLTRE